MPTLVVKKKDPDRQGVDADSVRIGKDVIEILTTGMYVSPITIYREYVQNSADAIDAARHDGLIAAGKRGRVSIEFDHANRSVKIRDNGIGARTQDAASVLLAIGGSNKRGTEARGFRGVGRLSGLAYCRELEFRTKARGDRKSVSITWNCRSLRERLADTIFDCDLKHVVAEAVSVSYDEAKDPDDHFFEVHLRDIPRLRNDMLLNEQLVSHYLSQVAPVPFSNEFSFAREIDKHLETYSRSTPVDLTVHGQQVFRPYRDEATFPTTSHTLSIRNIEYHEFPDVDGNPGAVAWLAHHDYVRSIPPTLGIRGLRARFGDLQVGEPGLFDDIFKEPRFNGWSIGEIHILDRRIVPNARRDNFELNHHYSNLLIQLGPVAANIAQHCRTASVSRNATQIVQNVTTEVGARLKQRRSFDRVELSRLKSSVLRAQATSKRIDDESTRTSVETKLRRLQTGLAKVAPKRGASAVALDEACALVSKFVTNRQQADKLIAALRRLCE
jgi:hypothetical protein